METNFTLTQLSDPKIAESEKILRSCVHCGFCIATCPTYVLLGDELDSPRGRIYLIKDMLENDRPASTQVVKHIDRCLSCLSCVATCPSGVNYMHLIDHARIHVENTYRRPLFDRVLRTFLAKILPEPKKFRSLLRFAAIAKMASPLLSKNLKIMFTLLPKIELPKPLIKGRTVWPAEGLKKKRVVLLQGCVQQVLASHINEATTRLLNRLGCEVVIAEGSGCCGGLVHHLGCEAPALDYVRANIGAWKEEIDGEGVDAIIINASGCGTTVKNYGFMLNTDPALADSAAEISDLARDISEYIEELGGFAVDLKKNIKVTYQSACSLQHGQNIKSAPIRLLTTAGFTVAEPIEAHLCCGSAGTYNIIQPEIAGRLSARKAEKIRKTLPEVVATGNIGCLIQLQSVLEVPVVHTVELLDWAAGGPPPKALEKE